MRYAWLRLKALKKDDISALLIAWALLTMVSMGMFVLFGVFGIPLGIAIGIFLFVVGGMI